MSNIAFIEFLSEKKQKEVLSEIPIETLLKLYHEEKGAVRVMIASQLPTRCKVPILLDLYKEGNWEERESMAFELGKRKDLAIDFILSLYNKEKRCDARVRMLSGLIEVRRDEISTEFLLSLLNDESHEIRLLVVSGLVKRNDIPVESLLGWYHLEKKETVRRVILCELMKRITVEATLELYKKETDDCFCRDIILGLSEQISKIPIGTLLKLFCEKNIEDIYRKTVEDIRENISESLIGALCDREKVKKICQEIVAELSTPIGEIPTNTLMSLYHAGPYDATTRHFRLIIAFELAGRNDISIETLVDWYKKAGWEIQLLVIFILLQRDDIPIETLLELYHEEESSIIYTMMIPQLSIKISETPIENLIGYLKYDKREGKSRNNLDLVADELKRRIPEISIETLLNLLDSADKQRAWEFRDDYIFPELRNRGEKLPIEDILKIIM